MICTAVFSEELYRKAESYVLYQPKSKHHCTWFGT